MACRWAATGSPRSYPGACRRPRRRLRRSPRSPDIFARPVAHDWSDLFIVGERNGPADPGSGSGEAGESASDPSAPKRGGLFRRLRESMAKTRQALGSEIQSTLFGVLDEHTWERLEEALIMADVGAATTASVVAALEAEAGEGRLEGGEALSERLIELLAETTR